MDYKIRIVKVDGEQCIEMIFPSASLILKPGESQTVRIRTADGNHIGDEVFTLVCSEKEEA